MRKLFTLGLALGFTLMANAEAQWAAGTDITADLEQQGIWGDVSGWWSTGGTAKSGGVNMLPNQSPWWNGVQPDEMAWMASDNNKQGYAAMGFYSDGNGGKLVDCFQFIPLPAGVYTIKFNATYREGTPQATWLSYAAHQPKQNAHFYLNVLDKNDSTAAPVQSYDKVISSLAGSLNKTNSSEENLSLWSADSCDSGTTWKQDGVFTSVSGEDTTFIYYPCSDEGASYYFAKNYYPHEITFYLNQDGYIRFGFKKTANIAQDWLVWAGIKMIYEGAVDDSWKLKVAQNDLMDLRDQILLIQGVADDSGIDGLSSLIEDYRLDVIQPMLKSTAKYADVLAAVDDAKAVYAQCAEALGFASSLADFIAVSKDMAADKVTFPGLDDFNLAISEAEESLQSADVEEFADLAAFYQNAVSVLSAARAAYLNSQDFDEEGYKNFTGLVKFPWFTQPQYNAEKEADGLWRIIQDPEQRDLWHHNTVAQGPSDFYSNGKPNGNIVKGDRVDVCAGVNIYGDDSKAGVWYQSMEYNDGWSPGLKLMYQGGLVGVSDGWNSGLGNNGKGGSLKIAQRVEGLPEGYYQIRCLMRGNDACGNWNKEYHNAFATNGNSTTTSPVGNTDSYYSPQWGWNEWNGNVWQEHRTGIIGAPNGVLTIGAQTSMVMNATGFRIYFFGTNPNFPELVKEDIEELANCLTQLTFLGDYNYVNGLYTEATSIDCTNSSEKYEQIVALCTQGKKYTQDATAAVGKWTGVEDYYNLQGKYEEGSNAFKMIAPAIAFAEALGSSENDTYEAATAAMEVVKAYQSYFGAYDKAISIQSALLAGIVAKHVETLSAGYCADKDQLAAMQKEIEDVYSTEYVLAEAANASESNPVDITGIIINPDFKNSASEGWEGATPTQNEYARGDAEIWNSGAFTLSQTLKMLPAGKYMIQCSALYRDGAGGTTADKENSPISRWLAADKDINKWATADHNVTLFMNNELGDTVKAFVNSVCCNDFTEPSFSGWFKDVDGVKGYYILEDLTPEQKAQYVEEETGNIAYDEVYDVNKANNSEYPWDTHYCTNEADTVGGAAAPQYYFFPECMFSAGIRFEQGYYRVATDVFTNSANSDVKIGLQKVGQYNGDWVIFGHFNLYCLGINTGIEAAKTTINSESKSALYNLAGQKVNASFKGIVVKNGQKMLNK